MLNKDQYNQEEYNDYYRQETKRAELGDSNDEGGGLISKLIILLVMLALAIAGYFGYKAMNKSDSSDIDSSLQVSAESSLPQSVQEEVPEVVTQKAPEPVVHETVAKKAVTKKVVSTEVAKAVATQQGGKMSPEEIAAIVATVMKEMNKENASAAATTSAPVAAKKDVALMSTLADTEVDSVSANLVKELEGVNISENAKIDNTKKQIDVYNKVNVQNIRGEDELSQLSRQITDVTKEKVVKDEAETYTTALHSETGVRANAMRIIVVKKGDTLGKLAKRAYGNVMLYKKIYEANPEITRPDRIYIGQKLRIPN